MLDVYAYLKLRKITLFDKWVKKISRQFRNPQLYHLLMCNFGASDIMDYISSFNL